MDALLPSEIARLVLGYLQEQKCEEIAKMFLETSPHLQECRFVAQRGGRYGTKVGGLNLTDMLDKYCAANSIIQEKLSKISDSEQIKNCNDIAEQLRYLLEGSRGHRFVVNINVPTQNSPNGSFGTPTLTTSSRKRQHSSSDRGKRVVKSLNSVLEKDTQSSTEQNCDSVEATPLESLPGHKPLAKKLRVENHTNNVINKSPSKLESTQSVGTSFYTSVGTQSDLHVVQNTHQNKSTETVLTSNLAQIPNKCTEGTNTEQPMSYCSTEVQTTPLDLFDTEHDINYEPIENLSILTEALIHRPELAEQIAENINKSIIPIQENVQENPGANLSLLQGFDSAVKSAVETSDKVLDELINEIFTVADVNQDENSNGMYNQKSNNGVCNENIELIDVENSTELPSFQPGQQAKRPDVPLKQRLRSSSKSQNNPDEDEVDNNTLLDNQNEEAIRSIVANAMASKQGYSTTTTAESSPKNATENTSPSNAQQPECVVLDEISPTNENIEPNKNANNIKPAKPKRNPRKPRTPKQKAAIIELKAEEVKMQEQNIITMPTLILCTENDVQPNGPLSMMLDPYLPIAPKPSSTDNTKLTVLQDIPATEAKAPTIFLRTVNVPSHLVKPTQLDASAAANEFIMQMQASPQKSNATTTSCSGSPIVVPIVITDAKQRESSQQQGAESITLYGDDSNSEVRIPAPVASMPVISLGESACNLATGTGLSPFFKGNPDAEATTQVNKHQPKTVHATKKLVEERETTKASDEKDEPEKQTHNNDKKEDEEKRSKIEKHEKEKTNETTNPTIVITAPCEDKTVSIEKESSVPEEIVENIEPKMDEKLVDGNKEKSIPEAKENKVDDEMIPETSECKVNKQSTLVEKEKEIEEKEEIKVVKKSVAAKKDNKSEEKEESAKKDSKAEEKSVPAKDTTAEEKPVLAKKDSKLEEKANKEINVKVNTRRVDALITKRTPKSLLKDRSKNNRLSLSTPRRRNSHVRALDFDERTPEHDTSTRKVPQSCTKPKSSAVQGLFQSPPFSGETPPVTLAEPIAESKPVRTHVSVPPIATRSPAPKLQGNWNKVAGIGMILGDSESSPEKYQSSLNLSTVAEEKEPPKSWDSDLRKIVGDVNEDDDKRPKSAKKCRRRNSIKGKTIEEPKSAKKNAKTPTSGVQEHLKITPPPTSLKPNIIVPMKTSPELLARFRDLQTPSKVDTVNVPPTPRVTFATPGTRVVKISSGKEISIKDCVNTPDFPPTPCIQLTPKIVEEEEHEKKPSPYYEPSEDTTPKEIASSEKILVQQVTTTVTIQKNIVELQESKTVEITKFGVIEANMAKKEIEEVESTSKDNSKEIIEEDSMGETNASADTTNTDSDSDSDSDSNSSTSSSSSNSSSSDSSSCSSKASSPTKSVNISHHDNSGTESEVDSPQKVASDFTKVNSEEPVCPAETSAEKEKPPPPPSPPSPPSPPPKMTVQKSPKSPQVQQLASTISAIITNEKPTSKTPVKPKIINIQTISPQSRISRRELEEKRQRVMAKFKQTANTKKPVTVRRVTAVKKVEVKQPVDKVVKQPPVKKIKPSPKKKVAEVSSEEVKSKDVVENKKENPKAKVDQVKRDLFAPGDEAEQRKTRSQSARKSVDENPPLPGVLECLQLIPANKSADELLDQTADALSNSQTNSLEVSFVYDDSVPIKKRKRNYSSSELENEYAFTFPDEDEVRVMKVQPYEEIFKLAPKTMKKKSPKKSPIKAKRKVVVRCPLAASSPIKKDKLQKRKLSKRKASPVKDEEDEKKVKVEEKGSLDVQALFKKIDVDKFLKAVHVSK